METFNIHMEITKSGGSKLTIVNKIYACTGWEAINKTTGFIRHTNADVIHVRFIRWEVLNPFQAHFQEELLGKNKKK